MRSLVPTVGFILNQGRRRRQVALAYDSLSVGPSHARRDGRATRSGLVKAITGRWNRSSAEPSVSSVLGSGDAMTLLQAHD